MKENKEIWILNHYATDMYFNETGRHYEFATNLLKQGISVKIFCSDSSHFNNKTVEIANDEDYFVQNKDGIDFIFVKTIPYKGNGISRVMNMFSYYFSMMKIYKKFPKPDVILASSVHPLALIAGIRISKKYSIGCITEVRDLWPEAIFKFSKLKKKSILGYFLTRGEYWIYKKSDAIIFTKEGDKDYLIENKWLVSQGGKIDDKKVYYVNNGVNLEKFDDNALSYRNTDFSEYDEDDFIIVYTGTINPVNDLKKIVLVAEKLKEYSDIKFVVYGEGTDLEKLISYTQKKGLKNISFKGGISKKYIPFVLSNSSVNLLHYSADLYNWTRGNSSNKLFEYLASGKPILSTVKMGYSPITKNKCGVESEENTVESISESIIFLYNLNEIEKRRMGDNSRTASKEFDYEKLSRDLQSIIMDVDKGCS